VPAATVTVLAVAVSPAPGPVAVDRRQGPGRPANGIGPAAPLPVVTDDHAVTVHHDGGTTTLSVADGVVLRDALLAAGLSPHSRAGRRLNCGGRGLCATCGVRLLADDPDPEHWHDRLAARFGYPRLSCQLRVTADAEVWIPEKLVWGGRSPEAKPTNPPAPNSRE
jgi:ferredoxin